MRKLLKRAGQSTLEYILITVAVVALAAILVKTFSKPANDRITEIGNNLSNPTGG